MSTQAQRTAYFDIPHENQADSVMRYIDINPYSEAKKIGKALGIPAARVTARLSPYLKKGKAAEHFPGVGNTEYYTPESEAMQRIKAGEYKRRNHRITKLYKHYDKEGKMTEKAKALLLAFYNEIEGTNF